MSGWNLLLLKLPENFDRREWDLDSTPKDAHPLGTRDEVMKALLEFPGIAKDDHGWVRFVAPSVGAWFGFGEEDPVREVTVEITGESYHPAVQRIVDMAAKRLGCWVADTVGETVHAPDSATDVFNTRFGRCSECCAGSTVPWGECPYCGGSIEPPPGPEELAARREAMKPFMALFDFDDHLKNGRTARELVEAAAPLIENAADTYNEKLKETVGTFLRVLAENAALKSAMRQWLGPEARAILERVSPARPSSSPRFDKNP